MSTSDATAHLAAGRLAEGRRAAERALADAATAEQRLAAFDVLIEAQILQNARLEAARSVAMARREASGHPAEWRLRVRAGEVALIGNVDPRRELRDVLGRCAEDLDLVPWANALIAVGAARAGDTAEAVEAARLARGGLLRGPDIAHATLCWLAEAHLALGDAEAGLRAAMTATELAAAHGHEGRRLAGERLARKAQQATSPAAQQAVLGLVDLASATAGTRDLEPLLKQVCRATLQLLDVDRAFVVLKEGDDANLRVAAGMARHGASQGAPSRQVVQRALRSGRELVSNDLDQDGSARSASIVAMGLRSVICAPMNDGTHVLGAIYGDSERVTEHELKQIAWLARGIAGVAAVAVANARRLDDAEQRTQRGREIAHDVRNLLNLVRLASEDIEEADDVPAWARALSGQARSASRSMHTQLERLLAPPPPRRAPVALGGIVDDLVALLGREARERGVTFAVRGPACVVDADPDELGRALANLLGNALKYSPDGGVVEVVWSADGGVRLAVRDEGPGIPADEIGAIFDAGRQARGSLQGFGLGLAIARRIIAEHGGQLSAENRADRSGACFVVLLPLASGAAAGP